MKFFNSEYSIIDNSIKYSWKETILDLVPLGQGLCLDLGSNDGRYRNHIESKGYSWVGLDIIASNQLNVNGSAFALPFKTNTFDIIVMRQVLEHLAEPQAALQEVNRVLKPNCNFYGSASFLESFHESFFCFTHWGLEVMMAKSNFKLIAIRPGPSVFVMLTREFFLLDRIFYNGLAPIVAWLIFTPLFYLYKYVSQLTYLLRHGKDSSKYEGWRNFWNNAPVYFAAELQWVAQKSQW